VNDVAVVQWRVLPAEKPRVVLIDEQRQVRTEFAPFVAKALGERRVSADETVERLPDRAGIEAQFTRAPREPAVGAVQQHPHIGTTNGLSRFRHPAFTLAGVGRLVFPRPAQDANAEELDALKLRLGAELLADGRVYAGTTRYRGVVAFRPAIVNWRTVEADVDLSVDVVRELGTRLGAAAAV
jgi:hypothetical protein